MGNQIQKQSLSAAMYDTFIQSACRHGKKFKEKIVGNTRVLIGDFGEISFVDKDSIKGKGFHIINLVKNDIRNYIKNNGVQLHSDTYNNQWFNLESLQSVIGEPIVAIDVNSCYFETAYQLNYITKETYLKANKKNKEWKDGRNASIGSLAREEYIYDYDKGEKLSNVPNRVLPDKELTWVRHHIIRTVCERFLNIIYELKSDYLMFLTDCIYCKESSAEKAKEMLKGFGYTTKQKLYEITEVDTLKRKISWEDISNNDKKYYKYSDFMILNFNKNNKKPNYNNFK